MNILGLHFGHDGAVAVIVDGRPKVVLLTERLTRVKHAVGIDRAMIERALTEASVTIADIAYCAVTSTQTVPLIFSRHDELVCRREFTAAHQKLPSPIVSFTPHGRPIWMSSQTFENYLRTWRQRRPTTDAAKRLAINRDPLDSLILVEPPENVVDPLAQAAVTARRTLVTAADVRGVLERPDERFLFHYPITIELAGRKIPGLFVDHHAAHAADVHYQSGLGSSIILTHDGAMDPRSAGLVCLGAGERIYPLVRPYIWLGGFYNNVAYAVGLNHDAGKLMGLAPYGQPVLAPDGLVGTADQLGADTAMAISRAWLADATAAAERAGYDMSLLGSQGRPLDPINRDLAASAHAIFEANVINVIAQTDAATRDAQFDVEGLALAGGCALSCPTNTRLWQDGKGRPVAVGPSCDDSGLAVGAALWVYHNVLGQPLRPRDRDEPVSPYLGADVRMSDVLNALGRVDQRAEIAQLDGGAADAAARDLADDRIVGWFEGRSEIGPRALGHRSLLADPRQSANWARVNKVKGRESWRPFAPAVPKEHAARYFTGMPLPSPYMLFTGDLVDRTALPAITHVDGTARVQTTSPSAGGFHDVLNAFDRLTSCPVVLNTSLNGPGEPIVETPQEAINFLLNTDCEVLYVQGFRIAKREPNGA